MESDPDLAPKGRVSTERRIYLFRFADDFMLIYPFYALLFAEAGLSTTSISLLFVAWSALGLVFEVPTGALADRMDRRWLLSIGQLTKALGFATWFIAPELAGFLVGFSLWAIGSSLTSGTYEALVFDELKRQHRATDYLKVSGRANGFALLAVLSATALASLVAHPGYAIALLASVGASIVAATVALSLPKAQAQDRLTEENFWLTIKSGLGAIRASARLKVAVAIAALAGAAYGALEEYSGLFVFDVGFSAAAVALVLVAIGITDALAAFGAGTVNRISRGASCALLLIAALALLTGAQIQGAIGIVLLGGFFFLTQASTVMADASVQHNITGSARATVTSVSNLAIEIISIGFFVVFALAGSSDRFMGFTVCAVIIGLVAMILMATQSSTWPSNRPKTAP